MVDGNFFPIFTIDGFKYSLLYALLIKCEVKMAGY